jgi:hypothetical protein
MVVVIGLLRGQKEGGNYLVKASRYRLCRRQHVQVMAQDNKTAGGSRLKSPFPAGVGWARAFVGIQMANVESTYRDQGPCSDGLALFLS